MRSSPFKQRGFACWPRLAHSQKFPNVSIIPSLHTTSGMETLNPDCLLSIFLELDFQQKVKIEGVCKKWFRILRSHYAYSNVHKLNIIDYMRRSDLNYFQQENLNFIPTIVGLLTRCGPYLHELSFGSAWYRISPQITQAISECAFKQTSCFRCV